ncbi:MAG: histone deacetylase [Chitinophagaceae bacterium]|nr:MAG: histone deacetylase [Chitinophagaceae bacterium]
MYSIAYHPKYYHQVPLGHRFPMEKYELLPQQLLHFGVVQKQQFFEPVKVNIEEVKTVHDSDYVNRFTQLKLSPKEIRRIGFLQDEAIVERELLLVEGTIRGALDAIKDKIAFNIAGGTHHASTSFGEGFCMLNDQAIAAQYLLDYTNVKNVLIIDLDVHQGNGTADIFQHRKDVFTFSMHCQNNYPFHKSKSHWDIGLADGTTDEQYLLLLKNALDELSKKLKPDFIFYQSGVDILETDKMGKLKCSIDACKARDSMVFNWAKKQNIPVQCSMGGGYSPHIKTILNAHTNTFIAANEVYL